MASRVNALGIIGFVFGIIGAGMLGGSVGTVYWQIRSSGSTGLFQACDGSECTNLGWSVENRLGIALIICRVILFISCLLCGIAFVLGAAALCESTEIKAAGGHHISSGILVLLGCASYISLMVLFVGQPLPRADSFGVSFYLCWCSGAWIIFAGIMETCGHKTISPQVHPGRTRQEAIWSMQPHVHQPPTNPYYQDQHA